MSLFRVNDEQPVEQSGNVFSSSAETKNYFRKASTIHELVKAIGTLEHGKSFFTFSNGKWSSHELLAYILQQTGPAEVWLTSWSITEEPLRMVVKMMKDELITQIHCLFGERVPVNCPVAWQYAKYNIPDIKLSRCHAKAQVIRNEKWSVVVIGSANLTNNPRWEAGVVCCDHSVAESFSSAIDEAINKGKSA